MGSLSRRNFLAKGAATAGAVAVAGQLVGLPASASASKSSGDGWPAAAADEPVESEPFVVYIHAAGKGEITLLSGEQEIIYTDRVLVSRLQRAIRRGGK